MRAGSWRHRWIYASTFHLVTSTTQLRLITGQSELGKKKHARVCQLDIDIRTVKTGIPLLSHYLTQYIHICLPM